MGPTAFDEMFGDVVDAGQVVIGSWKRVGKERNNSIKREFQESTKRTKGKQKTINKKEQKNKRNVLI